MHNISQYLTSKGNQTIKFGQLVEFNYRNIFIQKHEEKEAGRQAADLFLVFKKAS